ncbi:hypothetical protein RchiOBHm_Chr4g0385641 [Rosa chinensis]|uniref:Uncharacterized protein n=1 Tax=Rosa chinensis TaxID=74649 RepID=A0A2P6QP18_ROSCH|nr:hypothetical protein RchiOBHm_Chr4g0385641 [Rosa chinensis]
MQVHRFPLRRIRSVSKGSVMDFFSSLGSISRGYYLSKICLEEISLHLNLPQGDFFLTWI